MVSITYFLEVGEFRWTKFSPGGRATWSSGPPVKTAARPAPAAKVQANHPRVRITQIFKLSRNAAQPCDILALTPMRNEVRWAAGCEARPPRNAFGDYQVNRMLNCSSLGRFAE